MIRILVACGLFCASPAMAEFNRITDEQTFKQIIAGKSLTRPLIRLQVAPDGSISGKGGTKPVSGQWQWRNGFFCRDLNWGARELGYNCQEVRTDGRKIRFTSDQGTGDFADFNLR